MQQEIRLTEKENLMMVLFMNLISKNFPIVLLEVLNDFNFEPFIK